MRLSIMFTLTQDKKRGNVGLSNYGKQKNVDSRAESSRAEFSFISLIKAQDLCTTVEILQVESSRAN